MAASVLELWIGLGPKSLYSRNKILQVAENDLGGAGTVLHDL